MDLNDRVSTTVKYLFILKVKCFRFFQSWVCLFCTANGDGKTTCVDHMMHLHLPDMRGNHTCSCGHHEAELFVLLQHLLQKHVIWVYYTD